METQGQLQPQVDYRQIEERSERFFRSVRRTLFGLAALIIALWVITFVFYILGW